MPYIMARFCTSGTIIAPVAPREIVVSDPRTLASRQLSPVEAYLADPRRGHLQGYSGWAENGYDGKPLEMPRITPVVSEDDPYGEEAVA